MSDGKKVGAILGVAGVAAILFFALKAKASLGVNGVAVPERIWWYSDGQYSDAMHYETPMPLNTDLYLWVGWINLGLEAIVAHCDCHLDGVLLPLDHPEGGGWSQDYLTQPGSGGTWELGPFRLQTPGAHSGVVEMRDNNTGTLLDRRKFNIYGEAL